MTEPTAENQQIIIQTLQSIETTQGIVAETTISTYNAPYLKLSIPLTLTGYSQGEIVGGRIALQQLSVADLGSIYLESIMIKEESGLYPELDFLFFGATPLPITNFENKDVFVWSTVGMDHLTAHASVLVSDYKNVLGKSIATLPIGKYTWSNSHDTLELVIVAKSGYKPLVTNTLKIDISFRRF